LYKNANFGAKIGEKPGGKTRVCSLVFPGVPWLFSLFPENFLMVDIILDIICYQISKGWGKTREISRETRETRERSLEI